MPLSIVVIDDHQLFARSLACLLDKQEELSASAVRAGGPAVAELIARQKPDVLIMGPCAASELAPATTRQILQRWPRLPVLAVSTRDDAWQARRMTEAGASGFLSPDCEIDEAVDAIRALARGDTRFGDGPTAAVSDDDITGVSPKLALTRREVEVVTLICDCYRTSEIAQRLSISAKTVDSHRKNIMDKLKIRTIAGLTRYGLRHGLSTSAIER